MTDEIQNQPKVSDAANTPNADIAAGNLAGAVAGNYDFTIAAVLTEAWTRTQGLKGIVILCGLVVFIVIMLVTAALGVAISMFTDTEQPGAIVRLGTQLLLMAVIYPFLVGFMMLGIRRAVDLPIGFDTPFSYLAHAVPVVVTAILLSFLTTLGFFLLIIPGIYLSVAYLFALPLVVEKNLRPWQALEASRKAVTAHWFKIFAVFFLLSLAIVAGFLTLIGWIWTVPMWYAGFGIVYRTIFGVEETRSGSMA